MFHPTYRSSTDHAVPVVVGRAELNDFVLSHGASWCVLRSSDLHELVLEAADAPRAQRRQLGDRVILRLAKEDAR